MTAAGDATPSTPADGAGTSAVATLSVEGMHCGSCVALIEEVLGEEAGVTGASVDLDSARAVVRYDPSRLDVDRIQAVIADAGYPASPA